MGLGCAVRAACVSNYSAFSGFRVLLIRDDECLVFPAIPRCSFILNEAKLVSWYFTHAGKWQVFHLAPDHVDTVLYSTVLVPIARTGSILLNKGIHCVVNLIIYSLPFA